MTANIGSPEKRVSAVTPPQKPLKRMQGSSELFASAFHFFRSVSYYKELSSRQHTKLGLSRNDYKEHRDKRLFCRSVLKMTERGH